LQLIASADEVTQALAAFRGGKAYLHLETTVGAYTEKGFGVFIRNAEVEIETAALRGDGPLFRAGLRTKSGWVYAEGVTHWEVDERGRLLLEGHDGEGRMNVACLISREPWPVY
jgi:hypothetical protein